jgi:hypothetical protein
VGSKIGRAKPQAGSVPKPSRLGWRIIQVPGKQAKCHDARYRRSCHSTTLTRLSPNSRSAHLSLSFLSPFHSIARHILQRLSYCPASDCIAPSSLISLARGFRSLCRCLPCVPLQRARYTASIVTDYSAASSRHIPTTLIDNPLFWSILSAQWRPPT